MTIFLQIFLLFNVFLIGVLAATAIRHAYAHFRPDQHTEEKSHTGPQDVRLPTATRERLLQEAEKNMQAALDDSTAKLHHDLEAVAASLNKSVEHLGTAIVGNELERYRNALAQLHKQAEAEMGNVRTEIAKHQEEVKAKMEEEVAAEKEELVKQIDTKLADAVTSFLIETLQHNVDLGAQTPYLTAMLEEHKAELTKEAAE